MFLKTLAIASLTVRSAVRSRLLICLLVILFVVTLGIPLSVRGDGTALSEVKILLLYTLGTGSVILGLATLWASCSAVSHEVEHKQIRTVVVKPVGPYLLWFGKWIGIVILDAVLLLLMGLLTYALLFMSLRSAGSEPEDLGTINSQVLTARRLFLPKEVDLSSEVHRTVDELKRTGQMPEDVSEEETMQLIYRRLRARRTTVAPGASLSWEFDTQGLNTSRGSLFLRYRIGSSIGGSRQITGTWRVDAGKNGDSFNTGPIPMADGRHLIEIPASTISPGGNVTVRFENAAKGSSRTVIFHGDNHLELLAPAGGFLLNMVRSLLVVFCYLVVLAALGVTAGILFSFPVATFAAFSLSSIVLIVGFFAFSSSLTVCDHHDHDHGGGNASVMERVGETMLEGLEMALSPVRRIAPLGRLADGVYVPLWTVVRAVLILGVVCPGILGLLGGYCMSRRELAAN